MTLSVRMFMVLVAAGLMWGCATPDNLPLMFGQANTLGITINGSTASQGGEFTLGYRGADVAIVPVTSKQPNGATGSIASKNNGATDALSVLGQFQANSNTNIGGSVGLGTFFATGMAATELATGYMHQLAGTPLETKPAKPAQAGGGADQGSNNAGGTSGK
jgi:hypothetical protein